MHKLLDVAKLLTFASATALCCAATWLVLDARVALKRGVEDQAAVVKNVNADLGELHKVLYTSNVSAAEVGRAAIAERFYAEKELPVTLAKANAAIDGLRADEAQLEVTLAQVGHDADTVAASSADTLNSAKSAIDDLQPIEANVTKATQTLDEFLADPNLKASVANLAATSAAAAQTAQHLEGTTKDVQHVVHEWAYPTPMQRVLQWIGLAASGAGSYLAGKVF